MTRLTRRWFAPAAVAAVALTAGAAVALGAADGTIQACVGDGGALRIAATCKDKETALTWEVAAPESPAGQYALFFGSTFIGPLHALEGCTTESAVVEIRQSAPNGNVVVVKLPGEQRRLPCTIEVGLGLAPAFYSFLGADPIAARTDMRIVRVATGTPGASVLIEDAWASSIALTGVDASSSTPAYLRVRLANEGANPVATPAGLTLGSMVEKPIDPSTLAVHLGATSGIANLVVGFRASYDVIEHQQTGPNGQPVTVELPGAQRFDPLTLGSPPGTAATAALALRAEVLLGGAAGTQGDLTLTAQSAAGAGQRTLTATVPNVWPTLVEPFERRNGRHHGRYAGDAGWTIAVS